MAEVCKRCQGPTPSNFASPRGCAFAKEEGVFHTDNWNCGTMNVLRQVMGDVYDFAKHDSPGVRIYGWDESVGVLPYSIPKTEINEDDWLGEHEGFLTLAWYKNRGRTETAFLLSRSGVDVLTLELAEAIIDKYGAGLEG